MVLVGGCPSGTEVSLAPDAIHYDELELRGTFHHSYAEVDEALAPLAAGRLDWRALAGDTIATGGAARSAGDADRWPGAQVGRRPATLTSGATPPFQVLDDPPRVADHLALDHQHRDALLVGQRLHFRAPRASLRDSDLGKSDPFAPERAGDLAARAQPVGRGSAAVERRHRSYFPRTQVRRAAPAASRSASGCRAPGGDTAAVRSGGTKPIVSSRQSSWGEVASPSSRLAFVLRNAQFSDDARTSAGVGIAEPAHPRRRLRERQRDR